MGDARGNDLSDHRPTEMTEQNEEDGTRDETYDGDDEHDMENKGQTIVSGTERITLTSKTVIFNEIEELIIVCMQICKISCSNTARECEILSNWGCKANTKPATEQEVQWNRLDIGWVKLNTDGHLMQTQKSCGGLLRNEKGCVIFTFQHTCRLQHIYEIELEGALPLSMV